MQSHSLQLNHGSKRPCNYVTLVQFVFCYRENVTHCFCLIKGTGIGTVKKTAWNQERASMPGNQDSEQKAAIPWVKLSIRTCLSNSTLTCFEVYPKSTVKLTLILRHGIACTCFGHYHLVLHKFAEWIWMWVIKISPPYTVLSLNSGVKAFRSFNCCCCHLVVSFFILSNWLCGLEILPFLPWYLKG